MTINNIHIWHYFVGVTCYWIRKNRIFKSVYGLTLLYRFLWCSYSDWFTAIKDFYGVISLEIAPFLYDSLLWSCSGDSVNCLFHHWNKKKICTPTKVYRSSFTRTKLLFIFKGNVNWTIKQIESINEKVSSTQELINALTSLLALFYNQYLSSSDYLLSYCPDYNHCLHCHGIYTRYVLIERIKIPLNIRRVRCPICGKTYEILPAWIVPYVQRSVERIHRNQQHIIRYKYTQEVSVVWKTAFYEPLAIRFSYIIPFSQHSFHLFMNNLTVFCFHRRIFTSYDCSESRKPGYSGPV